MCFMIILSTSSPDDLHQFNSPLLQFSKTLPGLPEELHLRHPHRWFLGSRDGCSCGFRHLDAMNESLGFAAPEDWWPEEQEDIDATRQAASAFKSLLAAGATLDCIDVWLDDDRDKVRLIEEKIIDFTQIPEPGFRFIEGHRFEFVQ
jgi:hypothetical protein